MTETQQRFLRAIAERVPVHQVVELHLFPPIRQGGVETGVAVVAEDPRGHVPNAVPGLSEDAPALVTVASGLTAADDHTHGAESRVEMVEENASDFEAIAGDAATFVEDADGVERADATGSDEASADDAAIEREVAIMASDDESPYSDDDADDDELDETAEADDADEIVAESNGHARSVPFSRFTIHTARYRLTLKGVDRGKWEVDVVAEADAPLEAVDAVVRGVQRRAGDGSEPDRLSAEAFRGALEAPLATLER